MTRLRLTLTLVFGCLVIAAAAPLVQLATGNSVNNDLETNSPAPIALGLIAGLVFLGLPFAAASRLRLFTHAQLALLFAMFAIALPLVNLGLVRPFYQGIFSYTQEYIVTRIDTAGHGYAVQSPSYVPKVETPLMAMAPDKAAPVHLDPDRRDRLFRESGIRSHFAGVAADQQQAKEWREQGTAERLAWVVGGREVTDAKGERQRQQGIPWRLWTAPLLLWLCFFAAVYGAFMCLAEWLRRRWIEREHLAFPLVEVADAVVRADLDLENARDGEPPKPRPWRISPMLLIGIGIGLLLVSIEALGYYKFLQGDGLITYNISQKLFKEPPLKFLESVVFVLSPIVVGIAFLISLELSFSIWTMFAAMQLLLLVARVAGFNPDPGQEVGWGASKFPFVQEQGMGALAALTAVILWKGLRSRPAGAESTGARRWLLPVAIALCVAVAVGHLWAYGVRSWTAVALVVVLVGAIALAQARLRAETGLPTMRAWPDLVSLGLIFGLGAAIGSASFAVMATLFFLPLSLLTSTLSQQVENLELGRRVGLRPTTVAAAGGLAFLVALVAGGLSYLVLMPMTEGGIKGDPKFSLYGIWSSHFRGFNGIEGYDVVVWPRVTFILIGAAVFLLLIFLRGRFARFPWHPLAYPLIVLGVNNNYIAPYSKRPEGQDTNWVVLLWGGVFIAWLIKALLVKYGGMVAYRRAKPLFIGLIVGCALAFSAWSALHGIAHRLVDKEHAGPFWRQFHGQSNVYTSGGY